MDHRDARSEGRLGLAVDAALFVAPAAIVLLALGVALLSGCAATQSPALSPIPPRVIDRPEYGSCVETGGKIEVPSAGAVALLTSVCWMRADSGVVAIDASEPAAVDPKDSGADEGGE